MQLIRRKEKFFRAPQFCMLYANITSRSEWPYMSSVSNMLIQLTLCLNRNPFVKPMSPGYLVDFINANILAKS